jgi:leucyl-tRNA synthetase
VPEKDLPVVLPQDCIPDGSGNPLHKHEGFHKASLGSDKPVACPTCGKPARRETDTMDTFVDSSWYFMRYCDPTNTDAMVAEGTKYWMRDAQHPTGGSGMDQYIGGIEHAILHLLYARFWTKVMRDLGLVKVDEPFTKLLTQGMVLNHIYSRKGDKGGIEYFWPHEVQDQYDASGKVVGAVLKAAKGDLPAGAPIVYEGVGTMSKSKNNGVDPQDLIERYGADTARLYTMFTAPPEATLEWNDASVEGSYRFLRRVWNFAHKHEALLKAATAGNLSAAKLRKEAADVRRDMHLVLKQVSYDYERMQYNTVVSGCMKLLNALEDFKADNSDGDKAVLCEGMSVLLRMLYPACPHISAYLWTELGYAARLGDLLDTAWPEVDEAALVRDQIELMLQINGKLRGAISVPANASKEDIEQAALSSEAFLKLASGALHQKVIVVPGRLVNIVMAS